MAKAVIIAMFLSVKIVIKRLFFICIYNTKMIIIIIYHMIIDNILNIIDITLYSIIIINFTVLYWLENDDYYYLDQRLLTLR